MEDVKVRGYVHLLKISIGTQIFDGLTKNVYRFVASQGMSTSLIGLKKFIKEIENSSLVKLKGRIETPTADTSKAINNNVSLSHEIDVFVAKKDLPNIEKSNDIRFICYADSYMESIDEFKEMLAIAAK